MLGLSEVVRFDFICGFILNLSSFRKLACIQLGNHWFERFTMIFRFTGELYAFVMD